MGQYVGTLFLLLKHDLPRLFAVFVVINFSFGTGLYLTLVGHYNDNNVDTVNDNSTRYEIFMVQRRARRIELCTMIHGIYTYVYIQFTSYMNIRCALAYVQ